MEANPSPDPPERSHLTFPVVGIGASAGGIAAVQTVLANLPNDPDMALVVVLHLSPKHESAAAKILQTATRMPVEQVNGEVKIERNKVYVIPPTQDLSMVDGKLVISDAFRPRGRHIVIDGFFRTLADAHRDRAVGIVLSGSGSDGAVGIGWLKQNGGVVIAQSPEDAEHDGMPRSAIATGHVDIVLPAADIAQRLTEIWANAQRIEIPDPEAVGVHAKPSATPELAEEALRDITATLRSRTGHDFRHYKRATLLRRIERRLQVNQLPTLPAYREFLVSHPDEPRNLLSDILIGVTQFFRDRPAFEALERTTIPALFTEAHDRDHLRAWVAGCSTGEEAYSVGILLAEEASRLASAKKITLFATDIDERAIEFAREGRYPEAIAGDVPPTRLRSHFTKEGGGYRIAKAQRDMIVFAPHSVLRDPPFSRLDLICCRNLLIYLDRTAQRDVLQMFHFALRPGGYLFLGNSETVDAAGSFFAPVDKANRIYRATPVGRTLRGLPQFATSDKMAPSPPTPAPELPRTVKLAEMHQRLVDEVGSPSLVVTPQHEILHSSTRAGDYLRFAEGAPSNDVLQAVRPELRQALRVCLHQALQVHGHAQSEPVPFVRNGRNVLVRMSARVASNVGFAGDVILLTFDDVDEHATLRHSVDGADKDPIVAELEHELTRRTEQLQLTVEQYESSSEELKASNEELQAINEELRAASEELETSKEELQSTNEELITVNHELKVKVDETSEINDDLTNLIGVTQIATVFIDSEMRIKRFTPAAASIFSILSGDIGRPLFDITHKLDYPTLAEDAYDVFTTLRVIEREVRSTDGRWLLTRLLPYRTSLDRIGGVVLTFYDITGRRGDDKASPAGQEQMRLVADTMTDFAIITTDPNGRVTSWSTGAEQLFGWQAGEVLGGPVDIIFTPEDRAAGAPEAELRTAREAGRAPDERWHLRKDGTAFYVSGVMMPFPVSSGVQGFAKIARDLTSARRADAMRELQLSTAREGAASAQADNAMKGEFLAVMSHELKHPLNLINVNAQLLMTLPESESNEPLMRAARTIQRTVQGQARIIDDLLDMSRASTGKLHLNIAPLLLADALQPCLNWARTEARAKGIRFLVDGLDEPILIDGDPVRIEQIAWNLLSNAIKFSRSGGTISVRLAEVGNAALLEVKDSGRGIASEFLPHVFEMFRQGETATRRQEGGLGIGLALVKNLVELHGGRVEVESEGAGRGAAFRVRLPLRERSDFSPLVDADPAPGSLAGVRILLVDDTTDTLETFGYLLETDGAEVTSATSGEEAIEKSENADFDLIISDIGMPLMDGYELIAELRARPRTATVPAIALTGFGRPQDVKRALDAGFSGHLDKPVDFKAMRALFARLLAKKG